MHEKDDDVVSLQAGQALLQLLPYPPRSVSVLDRDVGGRREAIVFRPDFRTDDEGVSDDRSKGNELTDQLLDVSISVVGRGVNEIRSMLDPCDNRTLGHTIVLRAPHVAGKFPGPDPDLGDLDTSATQHPAFHR